MACPPGEKTETTVGGWGWGQGATPTLQLCISPNLAVGLRCPICIKGHRVIQLNLYSSTDGTAPNTNVAPIVCEG